MFDITTGVTRGAGGRGAEGQGGRGAGGQGGRGAGKQSNYDGSNVNIHCKYN